MVVLGVLLILVSLFADPLGFGREPGFGYRQAAGLVVGLALAILGIWRGRAAR
jgi:hypothetical protein